MSSKSINWISNFCLTKKWKLSESSFNYYTFISQKKRKKNKSERISVGETFSIFIRKLCISLNRKTHAKKMSDCWNVLRGKSYTRRLPRQFIFILTFFLVIEH